MPTLKSSWNKIRRDSFRGDHRETAPSEEKMAKPFGDWHPENCLMNEEATFYSYGTGATDLLCKGQASGKSFKLHLLTSTAVAHEQTQTCRESVAAFQ